MVNTINGKTSKGMHRTTWNLRYPSKNPIKVGGKGSRWNQGFLVSPGTYSVTLAKRVDGITTELAAPQNFEVVPLRKGALDGASYAERENFRKEMEAMQTEVGAAAYTLDHGLDKVKAMQTALARSTGGTADLFQQLRQAKIDLMALKKDMYGSPAKDEIGERNNPTVEDRLWTAYRGLNNTYGPTPNQQQSLAIGKKQLAAIKEKIAAMSGTTIPALEKALQSVGAPWIEGQALPK